MGTIVERAVRGRNPLHADRKPIGVAAAGVGTPRKAEYAGEMPPSSPAVVSVDGHRIRLTNLDKVLYPETGTTKADVLDYYARVADALIRHAAGRPVTRKRWVNGVGTSEHPGGAFFQKNLDASTPGWVSRRAIRHRDHVNDYPLLNDRATLTWLGQIAALELHVPQWQFGRTGAQLNPDRMVLDLDPGLGATLADCAEVARLARVILTGMGLEPLPVTSGSKGMHLYAPLDGSQDSDAVTAVARELARALEADHPGLVVSDMSRLVRDGRVFVDWSQNSRNKTTIAPYSLRGRAHPTVAAPRTWPELDAPQLRQLDYREVLDRLDREGDLLLALASGHLASLEPTPARVAGFERSLDRLARYRGMRDAGRTPEPVPDDPVPGAATEREEGRGFVIQEHLARRRHFDLRLDHDGVLVSWALPKGVPTDPRVNHLAVQTEDHPLEYATFEGTIPKGEYGAGEVTIWDTGTYELEKWREGKEVIAVLHGESHGAHRYALIHTRDNLWLIHLMSTRSTGAAPPSDSAPSDSAASDSAAGPRAQAAPPLRAGTPAPMVATLGAPADLDEQADWAIEMKWDGIRAIARSESAAVRLTSRNGIDLTASYPDLAQIPESVDGDAVLDGEILVVNAAGRPDFGLLQRRMNLSGTDAVAAAAGNPAYFMVFDVLESRGESLVALPWSTRRARLERILQPRGRVQLSPVFDGDVSAVIAESVHLGLEGVVAKRRDGRYSVGRRSRSWIKIKNIRAQKVVIGGWRPGRGRRAGRVGSLLMGVHEDGALRYVGRVGTGFRDLDLDRLAARFRGLATPTTPFDAVPAADLADVHWLTPTLVGEVEFAEWTSTGRLRHPTWRGWREDKNSVDVVRESS